jgi:hypothetical protein
MMLGWTHYFCVLPAPHMCSWIKIFDLAQKPLGGPYLKPLIQPGEIFATTQKLTQEVRDFPTLGTEEDIIKIM